MRSTSIPTSLLVDQQIPDYVLENNPKFVEFLTNYYEYLDQNENINDYIRNVVEFLDVDRSTQAFIDNFFEELKTLPKSIAADKRLVAKHLVDLYSSKGSEESFKLLFRILFDEEIFIKRPSENLLRTSDGIWSQEVFFTVYQVYGDMPTDGSIPVFKFTNQYGNFTLTPTRIVQVDDLSTRVYFDFKTYVKLLPDQILKTYDVSGNVNYVGKLIKSPTRLIIDRPGKFWQVGQVMVIPGEGYPTIARVRAVNATGGVTSLEIMEHGYPHYENQITVISPFPQKPTGSNVQLSVVDGLFDPVSGHSYSHYTLEIIDYIDDIRESVQGIKTSDIATQYTLEDYFAELYSGNLAINQSSTTGEIYTAPDQNSDITIQDWIDSRVFLRYEFDWTTKARGTFLNDNGQLSNQSVRLQDSYYYQLFSYVIQTSHEISEYRKVLSLIHPAGTKFFAEVERLFEYDMSSFVSAERTLSNDRSYFLDILHINETHNLDVTKIVADSVTIENMISKTFGKYLLDTVTVSDGTMGTPDVDIYYSEDYSEESYSLKTINLHIS